MFVLHLVDILYISQASIIQIPRLSKLSKTRVSIGYSQAASQLPVDSSLLAERSIGE